MTHLSNETEKLDKRQLATASELRSSRVVQLMSMAGLCNHSRPNKKRRLVWKANRLKITCNTAIELDLMVGR